jgi:hypothetical protein
MVFNFDKPETKDFTETVRLLAGLSKFVIADITNPKSSPLAARDQGRRLPHPRPQAGRSGEDLEPPRRGLHLPISGDRRGGAASLQTRR